MLQAFLKSQLIRLGLLITFVDVDDVEDGGAVGVDGFQGGAKGLGGFGTVADGDQGTDAGAQIVPNNDQIGIDLLATDQAFTDRFGRQQSAPRKSWMSPIQGDLSVDFVKLHDVFAFGLAIGRGYVVSRCFKKL